jgi:chromate transporter
MQLKISLKELAQLFLKLGTIGFGGPAAHIALMHKEVVQKKNWFTDQEFIKLVGATHLIPGPNSTELAIHIGHKLRGWKGLFTAGICFITPAVIITGCIAFFYKSYGHLPVIQPFIKGTFPAIITIIICAIFPMVKQTTRNNHLTLLGILILIASLFKINEILLIGGAACVGIIYSKINNKTLKKQSLLFIFSGSSKIKLGITTLSSFKMATLFLKIGAILYGSGYVLFAFLEDELVKPGFLSEQQLIDAITIGQFTPGPVFSAVTFIGYQLKGIEGAIISTCAIFLPSFLFVGLLKIILSKLEKSVTFSHLLDAVNTASLALIISTCIELSISNLQNWSSILVSLVSLYLLTNYNKINSAFIILAAGITGYFIL